MAIDFPNAPTVNQQFSSPNGLFVWDGVKWTPSPSSGLFVPEAPQDGKTYGRKSGAWNSVDAMIAPAFDNIGRNLLHNGLMRVQQRGQGSWTGNGNITADRWSMLFTADTSSISLLTLVDADRAAIGDEAATFILRNTFTGTSGAGAFTSTSQHIEDVRRLSGKTVITSFWARSPSGPLNFGVSFDQQFGTGGSPSGAVVISGTAVALTTTWARYSVTTALPSISGKTLGTNGDHYTSLDLWYSAGATQAPRAGVGVQSGMIDIWGIQLEVAQPGQTLPSPLDKPDIRYELSNCMRFYQIPYVVYGIYCPNASYGQQYPIMLGTLMRVTPTVTWNLQSSTNCSNFTVTGLSTNSLQANLVGAAAGTVSAVATIYASADL